MASKNEEEEEQKRKKTKKEEHEVYSRKVRKMAERRRNERGGCGRTTEVTVEEMPEDLVCKFPWCISVGSVED